jgi:integrase
VDRRRTVIKNHQLPVWFDAVVTLKAERDGRAESLRDYFLTVLFTRLRNQEVARLRWHDLDFDDQSFTITDTKNRDPHSLPLPDFLHGLLSKGREIAISEYVFHGLESGNTG